VNVELNPKWASSSLATPSQDASSQPAATEAVSTQAALSQVASSRVVVSNGKELTTIFTTTIQITKTVVIPNVRTLKFPALKT